MPDYDGRGQRATTVGDVAIWIPRGLLAPFYLFTERLLRAPLGFVVATADKNHWPVTVLGFFTFGPSQQAGIFPTAFFDFGLRPSVGLYGYVDRFFHPANRLTYQVGTWGPSWLSFSVKDQVTVAKDAFISLGASYNRRPDQPFYGRGPRSHSRDESRYGLTAVEVPLRLDVRFSHAVRLLAGAGLRTIRFHGSDCCGDPDISVPIAQGRFAAPPGYPGGYNALFTGAELVVDSRPRRPKNQTGARVAAHAEHGFDPSPTAPSNWLKWGGNAGAYLDLGRQRTVGLKGNVLFAERLRGTLPFLEEPSLGGFGLMRGYLQNRLVDRSALVGELEYRWPVWVFLDGTLQASVGNVFGTHLDELRAKLLRLSGAIGVRSNNSADHQLEVLVGFGTETFGEGLPISSIRIFVGGTNGF